MPYGFSPLTQAQTAVIRDWIDQGALFPAGMEDAVHWAYVVPKRPDVPRVHAQNWIRNPIDAFVLARLEKNHLTPSPEATPEKLLRRVYLDLTGLPPSIHDIDAYLSDKRPGAYERVVDRLLASPHYGEKMALPWLDLARYADTNGYEKDNRRTMWTYRDWVINAFNADMPYDQFTIKQVAGDLAPGATVDDRIATGFQRDTMMNEEGGVDPAEQRWLTLVDRVNTTSSTFLGTTMACAECHDHKYDPFKQKEYYQLLAFFDHCDEPAIPALTATADEKIYLQGEIDSLTKAQADPALTAAAKTTLAGQLATLQTQLRTVASTIHYRWYFRRSPITPSPARTFMEAGAFLVPTDLVTADTPAALNAYPAGQPRNRLGLANWLVDPKNPLTARVEVNRLWEQCFGRGLVETSEDFGSQGQPPANPELLDWLATELVRSHWSLKAVNRLIVTSATYRQSSHVTPAMLERDPTNRLFARGPSFRMDGEIVRDVALSAGGLLGIHVGGPSVFPQQPPGIWVIPYNGDKWIESLGQDKYRRGIYTFLRRTSPYPSLTTFDAPSRELCTVRRVRTNTPLQALTTLNDPAFVDAARGLARRMAAEGGRKIGDQITVGFRLCTGRRPTRAEVARITVLYQQELNNYLGAPLDASALNAYAPDPAAEPLCRCHYKTRCKSKCSPLPEQRHQHRP